MAAAGLGGNGREEEGSAHHGSSAPNTRGFPRVSVLVQLPGGATSSQMSSACGEPPLCLPLGCQGTLEQPHQEVWGNPVLLLVSPGMTRLLGWSSVFWGVGGGRGLLGSFFFGDLGRGRISSTERENQVDQMVSHENPPRFYKTKDPQGGEAAWRSS